MSWSEIEDRAARQACEGVMERQAEDDARGYCRKHHRRFYDECPRCIGEIEDYEFEEGMR